MKNGMVLLSSRERKALFRAVQAFEPTDFYIEDRQYQRFLDDLDDGGIWNPCFLVLPNDDDAMIGLLVAMGHGGNLLPEFEHDLEMLKDRAMYVSKRRDEPKKRGKRWPFAKKKGYYGPNWEEAREKAIQRDDEQCSKCGFGREEHRERFGHDLHVHHLESVPDCETYKQANRLENLKTLCFNCHLETEHGFAA